MKVKKFLVRRVVYQEQLVEAYTAKEAVAIVEDIGEIDCRHRASGWRAKEVRDELY